MKLLYFFSAILITTSCSGPSTEEVAIEKHLIKKNPAFKDKIKFSSIQEVDTIVAYDSLAHVLTVRANEVVDKGNYSIAQAKVIERKYENKLDSSREAYIAASRELDSLMKVDANSMDLFAMRTFNTLKNFAVQNLNNAGEKYDNDSITLRLIRSYTTDSSKVLTRVFEATYQIKSKDPESKEFYLNSNADSVLLSKPLN